MKTTCYTSYVHRLEFALFAQGKSQYLKVNLIVINATRLKREGIIEEELENAISWLKLGIRWIMMKFKNKDVKQID